MKAVKNQIALLISILFFVFMYGDTALLTAESTTAAFYVKLLLSFIFGFTMVYFLFKRKQPGKQ